MRSKKRTVVILIVVIIMLLGFAGSLLVYRNKLSSEENVKNTSSDNIAQSLSSTSNNRYFENFYDKPITDENIALDSIEVNRVQLGYDDENLSFEFKSKDEYMGSTYRFNILYKDIPLNSEEVRVLVDENGKARTLISREIPIKQLEKISTTPKVTQDEALNIAKETLGENFSEYKSPFGDEKSYPELIIYEINNKYILSYSINSGSFVCVINAENGNVVVCHSIMVSNSAEYEGQNGDIHQIFYDDYKDENYDIKNMLYDKEKNIYILDDVKQQFNMGDVFTIADIHSGKNKSAVDAMANTYRAVEYFKEKLNITFDKIFVQVNDTESIDNACGTSWKDNNKSYAMITFSIMSNKKQAQYSAYLDAVAHEYTHSVTNLKAFGSKGYNEDSNYFERNALMEAYSDIFGQLIEQKYTGETDWILFTANGNRNLKNQKTYSKRRKTKDNKGTEDNDYGYAHYNSIIISHTAYLMSQDNDNKKYDNKYLLDYDQLGQLWYGSLKYLDEKSNFSDCRYAIEQSARELIEKGVLLEGNLKVIEQAFNDVEVDSDTVRHGVENSLKVTTSTATTPSDPVEITEIESTEATTPPTATELQITAVDLIEKSIPEIISLMNGEYQIIKTENDGYIYIQNQSVFPGMEFYVQVSGDDIISANNGEELHSDSLKTNLESGKYPLDGIQVNQSGKIDDSISADMDYTECCKVLGNFNCVSGTGAYLSGAPSAVAYTYNVNNAEITLYFEITSDLITLLSLGEISSVSSEEMQSYNPHLMNTVIKKDAKADTIVALSLGDSCSGCIDNNGILYMWGSNLFGRLGNGTTNNSSTPIKIMDNVKEVNLGDFYSTAITKDGSLYMWGGEDNSIPVKIMDNVKTVSLGGSLGSEHIGAITEDGSLYMWGSNEHGKLGNGTTEDSSTPIKIMDNVKSIHLSYDYSAAITNDGELYMWGGNWCYQLGNGNTEDSLTPIKIMDNVKSVVLGSSHNAAINKDGSLFMWGYNDRGQIGNGTTENSSTPVKIMDNVKAVSLGSEHSGAITEDGSLYMWGDNFYNQLGYSVAKSSTPTKVLDNIKSIKFAGCQSSAITEDNVLYMWGRETNITIDDTISVSIGQFSYGKNHFGIIKTDGSLYMWGYNTSGELGNGESGAYAKSSTPIKIEMT